MFVKMTPQPVEISMIKQSSIASQRRRRKKSLKFEQGSPANKEGGQEGKNSLSLMTSVIEVT